MTIIVEGQILYNIIVHCVLVTYSTRKNDIMFTNPTLYYNYSGSMQSNIISHCTCSCSPTTLFMDILLELITQDPLLQVAKIQNRGFSVRKVDSRSSRLLY